MKELFYGCFAIYVCLPLSRLSRCWRDFFRLIKGKSTRFAQNKSLPQISWAECTTVRAIKVWEPDKSNGNVRITELAILSALASGCENNSNLFEIGTFDGRTTLNFAMNSPGECSIYTLDLPHGFDTRFSLADGEEHLVDKPRSGSRYEKYREIFPAVIGKIHQLFGDSAAFDFTAYKNSCSLVFVDGSHSYDNVMSDSRVALEITKQGGVVLWHDYGIWEDVTKALDELKARDNYNLCNIRGTSLVYWKKI
jgi:hypothetical protein